MEIRPVIMTLFVAFVFALILSPIFIPLLRRLKLGQYIRAEGPQRHQQKAGTPTMGGVVIVIATILASIVFARTSAVLAVLFFGMLGYGLIGFLDDFLKIILKRNLGLTVRQKLLGQLLIAAGMYVILQSLGHSSVVSWPGSGWSVDLGWLYFLFLLFINIGTANAVNLTDGLDGLLAGTGAVAFAAYALISWHSMMPEAALFATAMMGALLGFLVFNAHPAKVFMGDTGSLAIGGGLAALAVVTKTELLLVVIGAVFVIETLSVIVQVVSFKTRGKRIFRMSPLHHHFELSGWSEWRVVLSFWAFSLLVAGIGLFIYMV